MKNMVKINLVDLTVERLIGKEGVFYALERDRIVVGRKNDSDIQIFNALPGVCRKALFVNSHKIDLYWKLYKKISRNHFTIIREKTFYKIFDGVEDKASTNGVYVNGKKVCDGDILDDGDIISLGKDNYLLKVRIEGGAKGLGPVD